MNLAYGEGGLKLEINIPPQHILAKSKGGLIIEGGVMSSEYGNPHSAVCVQWSPSYLDTIGTTMLCPEYGGVQIYKLQYVWHCVLVLFSATDLRSIHCYMLVRNANQRLHSTMCTSACLFCY